MVEVSSHIVKLQHHTWRYVSPALRPESDSDDDGPRLRPALRQVLTLRPLVGQRVETLHLGHRDPTISGCAEIPLPWLHFQFLREIFHHNWAVFELTGVIIFQFSPKQSL